MNAVSLYVTASRLIFSSLNLDDSGKWSDINRLIVFLRQSLTCCVCGNLLVVPMTSAVSSCQHHVCKGCMGGKMRLKPSCSFCKDQSKFTENVQLRVLLQCYKKLCRYVNSTDIPNKWGNMSVSCASGPTPAAVTASASHGVGALISGPTTFYQLIEEGSNLSDMFVFSTSSMPAAAAAAINGTGGAACPKAKLPSPGAGKAKPVSLQQAQKAVQAVSTPSAVVTANPTPAQVRAEAKRNVPQGSHSEAPIKKAKTGDVCLNETIAKPSEESTISISVRELDTMATKPAVPSPAPVVVMPNLSAGSQKTTTPNPAADVRHKMHPVDIKLSDIASMTFCSPAAATSTAVPPITPPQQTATNQNLIVGLSASGNGSKKPGKRRGCRCGLATPNPGKLTCCGQRCPCYVDGKGCFDCKCRGCRNPHKANTNSGIPVTPAVKPQPTGSGTPVLTAASSGTSAPLTVKVAAGSLTAGSAFSSNAALVNTLQSNGVSCQLVTVGQSPHPGHQKGHHAAAKTTTTAAVTATTTITLTSGKNNLFLSPSICLINASAAATAASAVCHSDASLTLPLMAEDVTGSPQAEDNQQIPYSMILEDSSSSSTWGKK